MVDRASLLAYCDTVLQPAQFQDYCPNGLQVAGRNDIHRIVSGVTANQALLEAALAEKADLVLVHHGYFWRGEDPCVTGIARHRLKLLLTHDINLLAYHLPLDAHPTLGNNQQLAGVLGITPTGQFSAGETPALGWLGTVDTPLEGAAFAASIASRLGRVPLHIPGSANPVQRIAWCTGGAQDFITAAASAGVDAYLTGEVSERTVNIARELGLHFYACGHHATERYGVKALGEHLAAEFGLAHQFVDIDNPA